jgi:hypothetical protein
LREAIAGVRRVAFLANPNNASHVATLTELKLAAAAAGMVLIGVEVGSATEFDSNFAAMLRQRPDAMLVSNDPFHQLHLGRIIGCTKLQLPYLSATSIDGAMPIGKPVESAGIHTQSIFEEISLTRIASQAGPDQSILGLDRRGQP